MGHREYDTVSLLEVLQQLNLKNASELRYYDADNSGYVGFKAPSSPGNLIWTLPGADGDIGQVLSTDGAGNLVWNENASEKTWAFKSPSGSTGTFYFGGYYLFHSTSFTPAVGTAVGTANGAYGAHAMIVLGASSTDMVVRVSGTSVTDAGVRTPTDFEDLDTTGGSANDCFETDKKWIGQITFTLQSGTGVVIDAGFCKYWDNNNTDFRIEGFEATWLGGANDSGADIHVIHHRPTGWTYSGGGGTPTPPAPAASMATDYSTESNVINGAPGAWKRTNLADVVDGSGREGVIIKVITTANKAFDLGNLMLRITPQ